MHKIKTQSIAERSLFGTSLEKLIPQDSLQCKQMKFFFGTLFGANPNQSNLAQRLNLLLAIYDLDQKASFFVNVQYLSLQHYNL